MCKSQVISFRSCTAGCTEMSALTFSRPDLATGPMDLSKESLELEGKFVYIG